MGFVRGTARAVSAALMALTMLAVLAQPASAEPDVQISTVCTDAGNRRIRLKQDTDVLIQWFLDGTPYLEPNTDVIVLTSVPGDGKEHVIELKEMPDQVVIATFEVTFELCDQPSVTTKPPATTATTKPKPTTTKQVSTTASTTPTTDASTTTAQATTTTAEPTEEASTTSTTRDDTTIAADGAEIVLGALAAILPRADDPDSGQSSTDQDSTGTDESSAQTLPPEDLLAPPPSLAASDDPSLEDGATPGDGSMSGVIIIAIIGAIAAGLVGLVIGRRANSASPDTASPGPASPSDGGGATAVNESLPSAQELLATRSGAKPVFAEPPRANDPLPQRQRSPKS